MTIVTTSAATATLALIAFFSAHPQRPLVIYSAPTLAGISDELARIANTSIDVQIHGSVFAANLIKSGKTPDLFLSVDSELKSGLNYRGEKLIGVYRLLLVCAGNYDSLEALKDAKIGIADPNQAPIGYRALAAIYLISLNEGYGLVEEVERSLNIRYLDGGGPVKMLLQNISASGRFYMRSNLDFVGSLLEAGVVDCIFAHVPFVIIRKLYNRYNIIEMPDYARFEEDPPIEIVAVLRMTQVKISRFEAVALSFTEGGDRLLQMIDEIDVEKFGIKAG